MDTNTAYVMGVAYAMAKDAAPAKMSARMQKFWYEHGNRFFYDVTCDAFINDLKNYRGKENEQK